MYVRIYVQVEARLRQRLTSTFLKFFHSLRRLLHSKKLQKMLILAFEANSAVTLMHLFRISAHCVKVKNFRKFQSAYCKQQTYIIISNKGNIVYHLYSIYGVFTY